MDEEFDVIVLDKIKKFTGSLIYPWIGSMIIGICFMLILTLFLSYMSNEKFIINGIVLMNIISTLFIITLIFAIIFGFKTYYTVIEWSKNVKEKEQKEKCK